MSDEKIQAVLGDFPNFVERIQEEATAAAAAADSDDEAASEHYTLLGAICEAAFIVAASDGEVSDEECEALAAGMCEITGGIDEDTLQALFDQANESYEEEGQEARIAAVGELITDQEYRRGALCLAAACAYVDGQIGTKQGLALQAIARSFDIEISELHQLMAKAHAHMS